MARQAFTGETIVIPVSSSTSGLTDLELIVTKPDGTDEATNLALSEIGTKGFYTASYIPTAEGSYFLEIVSPTDTSLAGKVNHMVVTPISKTDLGGAGYTSSTDGLSALSGKLNTLLSSTATNNNGFID